jgi:hypothetical protein
MTGTTSDMTGTLSDARRFGVNDTGRAALPRLLAVVNARGW